jgi:hypothetical protein
MHTCIFCHLLFVGMLEQCVSTTTSLEVRDTSESRKPWVRNYGTIDAGLETMQLVWPDLQHRFAVRRPEDLCVTVDEELFSRIGPRYPADLSNRKPVDLLIVEQGHLQLPPSSYAASDWETLLAGTAATKRPRVVVEAWNTGAHLWEKGPTSKAIQTRWEKLGYTTRCRRVDTSHVGGAITQVKLLVARVHTDYSLRWVWKDYPHPPYQPRPMGNLLVPPGLIRASLYCQLDIHPPQATLDPMPCSPGAWIQTERGGTDVCCSRKQLEDWGSQRNGS